MPPNATATVHARSDERDWLVEADEPLAGLQLRSGGELPGVITSPALLELVRQARAYGLKLARAVRAQDDHEQVTAWVEDAGPGVPEGDAVSIFERFKRGGSQEPEPGGLGLGLWISRSIVERHGGSITTGRTADGFTRFTITLPVEAGESR